MLATVRETFRRFKRGNVSRGGGSSGARAEVRKQGQQAPTSAETAAIQALAGIIRELTPEIMAVFDSSQTSYTVAQTETVLGELRAARSYRLREVFLSARGSRRRSGAVGI